MEEKIQDLYYKYLKDKLDIIFDFNDTNGKYTLGEQRFRRPKPIDNFREEMVYYGPHDDYDYYRLLSDEIEIDKSNYPYYFLGEGFYKTGSKIKHKNGNVSIEIPNRCGTKEFRDGVSVIKYLEESKYDDKIVYRVISEKGYLCDKEKFLYAETIGYGFTLVQTKKGFNVIDINGNYIFRKWAKDKDSISINNSFINSGNETYPIRTEFLDYKIEKATLGNKYTCKNNYSSFNVIFTPVRIYGYRYCLGYINGKVYLYDRALNKYRELGSTRDIEYSDKDDFIIDVTNEKAYMIYEGIVLDISKYYKEMLSSGKRFSINKGVKDIISYDLFTFKNMDEIDALFAAEREKNKQIRKEIEEKKKLENLEEEKKKKIEKEKDLEELESTTIRQLKESVETLQQISQSKNITKRIKLDDIFVKASDHFEIMPELIPILKHIDLAPLSFANVKMSNIDFSNTNITFNPQTVYQKDLSYSNFEGVYFSPFADFSGVNIKGCRFSDDNDPKTIDYFNSSFRNAIYDETTLYNNIPLTQLIEPEEDKKVPKI